MLNYIPKMYYNAVNTSTVNLHLITVMSYSYKLLRRKSLIIDHHII